MVCARSLSLSLCDYFCVDLLKAMARACNTLKRFTAFDVYTAAMFIR